MGATIESLSPRSCEALMDQPARPSDPSEREFPGAVDSAALELTRFVLRGTSVFPALEEMRAARDALKAARSALGAAPTPFEARLAERLDASLHDLREMIYAARIAVALAERFR